MSSLAESRDESAIGVDPRVLSMSEPVKVARSLVRPFPVGAGLLALVGVVVVLYATPHGPWAYSDSTEYIVAARNLLSGRGLGLIQASGELSPLSLHPPLYPLTLALGGLLGADLLEWSRWLNAFLFGGLILLATWMVRYATQSAWLALGAGLVILVHTFLIEIHTGAMSEPLFLITGIGGLWLLLFYLERKHVWLLFASGLACGAALLTRFPGIAFLGGGISGLALHREGSWGRRARDAVAFIALAAAPLVAWQMWLAFQVEGDTSRQWNLAVGDLWQALTPFRIELVTVVWKWIPYNTHLSQVPYWLKPRLMLAIALSLAALAVAASLRISRREATPWPRIRSLQFAELLSAFALLSVGTLAAVFVYSVPALDRADVDRRMLLPSEIALILAGFGFSHLATRAWPRVRAIPWLVAAGIFLIGTWYLPLSKEFVADLRRVGVGYTSLMWRNSPTLKAVQALPLELPLITNESAALMLLLDRPAYDLPELVRGEKLSSYARFGDGQDTEERLFREHGAALVVFDTSYLQFYRIYEAGTEERLKALVQGLDERWRYSDGAIYFYDDIGGTDG